MRHAGILGGRLWVTRCNRHVTVIPTTPLTLTTIRDITGHIVLGRVAKLGGDASIQAGLVVPADRRSRRHALTFHLSISLTSSSKPRGNPGVPIRVSLGCLGRSGSTSLIAWHAEFIPFVRWLPRA